ncbi:MFS transporter [Dyella amyloliquefaciens]|uniref:MFS transporter n=1 Tax=Dyella amyloliquefaciens TaxID=1770545 RepID=UPI00102E63F4|nr:MFS transporter [Dyella amyloliquefaciens]
MHASDAQGDRGAGPVIIVAASLAVMFIGATLPAPLYPLYRQRFGFSEVTLTLVYSVYVVGNLGALFFFARLSDQIGRKVTAWPAIGIGMLSAAAFGFAGGTTWLFVARALSGFATGLTSSTLTAWIAELQSRGRGNAGAVTASVANFSGLAIGPLIGGLPAQLALQPLRLPFAVYFAALLVVAIALLRVRETVKAPKRQLAAVSLRPRLGVPRELIAAFTAPAVTAFVTFAVIGFYAALIPGVLSDALKETRPLVSGGVLFLLFTVAAVAVIATRGMASRTAMLTGLALFPLAVALLIMAEHMHRLSLLLAASALTGGAASLGYRGSLAVVNRIAPEERRGEVVSTYLIVMFSGNSLPVIGIGLLSAQTGPASAHAAFAGLIILLALLGLSVGWRYAPADHTWGS